MARYQLTMSSFYRLSRGDWLNLILEVLAWAPFFVVQVVDSMCNSGLEQALFAGSLLRSLNSV
jgi:hypothetical protein